MSEQWRQLAVLGGVEPLSEEDKAACPVAVVTENGDAFDVAAVLIAFAHYVQRQSDGASEVKTGADDASE